ncbi:uncharacterized protein LOC130908501 [Corythoichthys intestinalis]|uniref:uncharacterized protein LOC130908501 n=1 Tax=Corythoichthys intestinalis TaxID=161448 RepID=UPI0025A598D4|nr:uncharacterized protein LOC130908501 [Corythoichthys intestinalis]
MLTDTPSAAVPRSKHHVRFHVGSIVLAFIAQLTCDILSIFALDETVPNALFQTSINNVSESFPIEVTMDIWSNELWFIVVMWCEWWLIAACYSLCKRGNRDHCNPEILPPLFYLTWIVVCCAGVGSLILWDRRFVLGAVILSWIQTLLSFGMLILSFRNLYRLKTWLFHNDPKRVGWIRYWVQNGLGLYFGWSFLNSLIHLGIALKYIAGVEDPLVSTIILTILLVCSLVWCFLQSFLLREYIRYNFTTYIILILGLAAICSRGYWHYGFSRNMIYCGCLFLLLIAMSVAQMITLCMCPDKASGPVAMESRRTFGVSGTVVDTEQHQQNKM